MKQRTKKKWQRSLAAALSFALLLPMTANLSVGAAGETASSGSQESLTLGSSGTWTPNYDRKPQNTKGDLTVDQLRTKQLDEKDIPEAVGEKTAREKDHAHRLYQQEEDMNTVIFQNRDGTKTMYYFPEPVKYKDETGKVKDKSNALTQRSDGSAETTQNDVRTRFPKDLSKDSGVTLSYQGRQILLSPAAGVGTARRVTYPKTDESLSEAVSYDSIFGEGTSLRYTPTFEGFKEDIILDRYTGQSRFSFRLQTGGLTLVNEKGSLSLVDPLTGKTVADIGELVVYDSTGDMSAVIEGKYTHKSEVRTVKQDSEYILTMAVDEAYLQAETTVYPVYVDPSFHVYSVTNGQKTIQDATIYSGYSQEEGYLNWIYAGAYPGRGTARSLVKFPGLVYTDPFQSLNDSQITSVKYMVYNTNPQYIDPSTINVYMLTRGWIESDVKYDSLLWDAAGQQLDSKNLTADGTSSSGTGTGNWYGFNITSAALQWKNYTAANFGIMLRDTVESKYVKAFYSSDSASGSPFVVVEYSQYISTPAPGVQEDQGYYIQNFNSILYMGVYNGGTESGTSVLQEPFYGTVSQKFSLIQDCETGYYKIASTNAQGKVLTIGDYGYIELYPDYSLNSQLWRIEVDCDTYYFISRTDEMSYLSVNNHDEWTNSLVVSSRGASSAWKVEIASLSQDLVNDIEGPPRYFPNGEPITANNKMDYYDGQIYISIYFQEHIWPLQQAIWEEQQTPLHLQSPLYTVLTAWAQRTYGLDWLEQFWSNSEAFLLGISDAVASTLEGTYLLITNPGQTVEGLGVIFNAIMEDGPDRELLTGVITQTINNCWDDFTSDTPEVRSRMIGRVVGEILVSYVSAKGITKLSTAIKNSNTYTKIVSKVGKGVLSPDDAVKALDAAADAFILMDDRLASINHTSKIMKTAEEINEWWRAVRPDYLPPYKPGTTVYELQLTQTTRFARVFPEGATNQGGWVMKADDIAGLTAQQIKDKFALEHLPIYMVDADIPAGTTVRCGIAGEQIQWGVDGGGVQFDLMNQQVGDFINKRLIP